MDRVVIDVAPVPLADLLAVARGAAVELTGAAMERIASGRRVVDGVLASGRAVYGLTTGVGHNRDVRVPDAELVGQQYMIVRTHSGGFGPALATEVARAAMAVRLVGLTRGGSGATPAVADSLVGMLNAGVHPLLPRTSSVGAADIGAMALIAQVAIGAGRAEYGGEVLTGGEALARAGIPPLVLQAKDGLALVSANGVSVGQGALVVERAVALADAAELVAALSMEATRGNPSIALPVVAAGKPFPGLVESCRQLRAALAGSYLMETGAPASVQDPLSFRVVPQVHGAFRDVSAFAGQAVGTELNAQADNPLVSPTDGTLVSTGTSTRCCSPSPSTPYGWRSPTSASSATAGWGTCGRPSSRRCPATVRRSTVRRRTCRGCTCGTPRRRPTRSCASWRPRSASTSASSTRAWRTTRPTRR
jgi:histidine ammonia-lyase